MGRPEEVYETDIEKLKYIVRQMDIKLETAGNAYKMICGSIEAVGGLWSGTARDEFMEKISSMKDELGAVIRDFQFYADDMKSVCGEYEKTDDEISGIVSSVGF